jgi:hypothetical protein
MARELADVIHYFLDDAGERRAAAPLLALPIGEKEPLRLAFVWNLAVELARRGVRPSLLVPEASTLRDLLPAPAVGGVLAPELVLCSARTLGDFQRDIARAARPGRPDAIRLGIVPSEWIAGEADAGVAADLFRWTLMFAAPDPTDLEAVRDLASRVAGVAPGGILGVTIHGVECVAEAKAAFELLAGPFEAKKGRPIRSYGLLLDDLLVYRGVVERRPVVLSHPQSLAARALADLAGLVLADAREPGNGP